METNREGKAILVLSLAPRIELHTWNNALSDFSSGTLIEKGTSLYQALMLMKVGDEVSFSGDFRSSDDDYVEESSVTLEGSMTEPEFVFSFDSISKIEG